MIFKDYISENCEIIPCLNVAREKLENKKVENLQLQEIHIPIQGNINNSILNISECDTKYAEINEKYNKYLLKKKDIVIKNIGDINFSIIGEDNIICPLFLFALRPKNENVLYEIIAILNSREFKKYIASKNSGSFKQKITMSTLLDFQFNFHNEQQLQRIGKVKYLSIKLDIEYQKEKELRNLLINNYIDNFSGGKYE